MLGQGSTVEIEARLAVAGEAAEFVHLATGLGKQFGNKRREVESAAALVGFRRAELDTGAGVALLPAGLGDYLIDG